MIVGKEKASHAAAPPSGSEIDTFVTSIPRDSSIAPPAWSIRS
jgi:hypothetical protein